MAMAQQASLSVFLSLLVALLLVVVTLGPAAVHGDEDRLTPEEVELVGKFREIVKDLTYKDYMTTDEYLVRWLRAKNLDVNKAAELLRKNLKWRKEEDVDSMADEKFPQFSGFLYENRARDKEGRPVSLFAYSTWDTRKAAISGQMKLLVRYAIRSACEVPEQMARAEGQADGTNATQLVIVADLGGYNLRQHACIRCFELYTGYVLNYEAHYPQLFNKVFATNTPQIFDQVLVVVRPIFSAHFANNLKILGPNKDEWKAELLKQIKEDDIPVRMGGTNSRKMLSG